MMSASGLPGKRVDAYLAGMIAITFNEIMVQVSPKTIKLLLFKKKKPLLFELALILVDRIGPVTAKNLIATCGSAEQVFREKPATLKTLLDNDIDVLDITKGRTLQRAHEELLFTEKNNISIVCYNQPNYPQKLKHCDDSPILLFTKGNSHLNPPRAISIVGTRGISEYGREICKQIIAGLSTYQPVIVSGLARGADTLAHKLALENNLETFAVVAHSLDRVYPVENRELARQIAENGQLISEHFSGSKPDKENFPKRNRIVAGISSTTIVIETAVKGGSMITASLAADYSRDVMAVPGRVTDNRFSGCNLLIASNKAAIYTGIDELIRWLGWEEKKKSNTQQALLFELSEEESVIVNYLKSKGQTQIDTISLDIQWPLSKLNARLLEMELKGLLKTHPGKVFSL